MSRACTQPFTQHALLTSLPTANMESLNKDALYTPVDVSKPAKQQQLAHIAW